MKYLAFILIFYCAPSWAQDERYFREFFGGELKKKAPKPRVFFKANSPLYEYDLDGDNRNESFVLEKRDGEDWLHVHGRAPERKRIFSYRLSALGPKAHIYKISIRNLSSTTRVCIIHYYEGYTKYLEAKGTSRLYFLTMDNLDLKTLSMFRGPIVWEEIRSSKRHYYQRNYDVVLHDFNKDGIKEISVRFNVLSTVFFYEKGGNRETF